MAHGIKVPAAKPEHLSLAPGADVVKGEQVSASVPLLPHASTRAPCQNEQTHIFKQGRCEVGYLALW